MAHAGARYEYAAPDAQCSEDFLSEYSNVWNWKERASNPGTDVEEMDAYAADRSPQWQESERGEEFIEHLDATREQCKNLQDLAEETR